MSKKRVKTIVSKFCCQGFYGEKCRCEKCCKIYNKPYSRTKEHKNWVYAQVMRGESFIVDDVRQSVIFENDVPISGESYQYYFQANRRKTND